MRRYLLALLSLLCLVPAQALAAGPSFRAVVSIAPQKYILERIAGKDLDLEVTVLVKPGSDPHSYEPSPSQMRAVAEAGYWFTIGVPFEDIWLPRIRGAAPGLCEISMAEGLRRLPMDDAAGHEKSPAPDQDEQHGSDGLRAEDGDSGSHGGQDPHIWLSPVLVRAMTAKTAFTLACWFPDQRQALLDNGQAFMRELDALDQSLALAFNEIPLKERVFLSFHPSWRYFALNYGLTELTIEVNGKEPGPRSMASIVDAAKAHGIRTIFVEPQFPRNAVAAIAKALDAKVVEADPLAEKLPELYRDLSDKLLESFKDRQR
ncbi:zinc ABC transporter substrate-binding protein [Desulfovibrio sp. OttesenSCG-928-G11]|nr:zinc ABC transporter substrate-binding protein [Desulfovibrio sp. OttesenSCG-928-G11]